MIRITRILSDVGDFLCDTAVLHFDTDFSKIYGDIIFTNIISLYASQNYSTLEYSFIVSDYVNRFEANELNHRLVYCNAQ